MRAFSSAQHGNAMIMLQYYLGERLVTRISFMDFKCLHLESYSFIKNVSISFVLYYNTVCPYTYYYKSLASFFFDLHILLFNVLWLSYLLLRFFLLHENTRT
jgi:hypothetical protein